MPEFQVSGFEIQAPIASGVERGMMSRQVSSSRFDIRLAHLQSSFGLGSLLFQKRVS